MRPQTHNINTNNDANNHQATKMSQAERAALLISHHCRCAADAPCKEEEAMADKCAAEGKTPFAELIE